MYSIIRISSKLTFFYRWVVTITVITFNVALIIAALFFLPKKYNDLYLAFVPFSIFASSVLLFFLVRLRNVSFNERELFIDAGEQIISIELCNLIEISRYFFYFYQIKYKSEGIIKKVLLLPSFREMIISFGLMDTKSVKMLRKFIDSHN